MPLSGNIHHSLDKSHIKWSLPHTIQFVAVACGLCWLLFLIGMKFL